MGSSLKILVDHEPHVNVKSPVGAIGVMQVMPPTGLEQNVGDITKVEANIHAGVKYLLESEVRR